MTQLLLLFLSLFVVSGPVAGNVVCYKGDILHNGALSEAPTEETTACRIHFEMMDETCSEDKVDVIAARAGKGSNETLNCELLPTDNMVECECAQDKCNTPSMVIREVIASLNATTEKEEKIVECFLRILENKFNLTTTTTTTTTSTTTAKDFTTVQETEQTTQGAAVLASGLVLVVFVLGF